MRSGCCSRRTERKYPDCQEHEEPRVLHVTPAVDQAHPLERGDDRDAVVRPVSVRPLQSP